MPGFEKVDGWYKSDKGNFWLLWHEVPDSIKSQLKKQDEYCRFINGFYITVKKGEGDKFTVYKNNEEQFQKWRKYHPSGIVEGAPANAPPAAPAGSAGGSGWKRPKIVDIGSYRIPDLNNEVDEVRFYEFVKAKCKEEGFRPWGNNPNEAIHNGRFWMVKEEQAA